MEKNDHRLTHPAALDDTSVPFPVFMGSACNLNCACCAVCHHREPRAASREQLSREIQDAAGACAPAVIFTGGEPTLHKSLPACLRAARELPFSHLGIRTNGMMLLYREYLQKLIACGLSFVQISHLSHDADAFDAFVNVPGAHEMVLKGVAGAMESGLAISAAIPLVRSTFVQITNNVEFILREFESIKQITLTPAASGAPGCEPAPIGAMEDRLPEILALCAARGVALSFDPFAGIPPCLFKQPETLLSLFRYPAAAHYLRSVFVKNRACGDCPLDALCNGIRPEYIPDPWPTRPGGVGQRVAAAVARGGVIKTRASGQGDPEARQAADDAVTISRRRTSGGKPLINDCIIRVNYRCNQNCLFCFVDTQCGGPSKTVIREAARALKQSEQPISIISLSGGEPALNPHLDDYLDLLKETGASELCIQTNAVLMSDPARAARLASHGLDSAFVSLHSHDPVVSDLITGQEGAFGKTLEGIANLAASGVFVYLSHVINAFNYQTLPEFVDFVHTDLHALPIVFSVAAPHRRDMMFSGAIPRMTAVREPLRKALRLCLEKRIPFSGLPGMCGLPLCVLGPDLRFYPDIHPVDQQALQGVMHKNTGCSGCSLNTWCYGVRTFYVELYGDEELSPIRIQGFDPKLRDMRSRMVFFKSFFD